LNAVQLLIFSFYVLLCGTVSVYINPPFADEEDEAKIAQKADNERLFSSEGELDRDKLGNLIRCLGNAN
jgi:hypothetical protein